MTQVLISGKETESTGYPIKNDTISVLQEPPDPDITLNILFAVLNWLLHISFILAFYMQERITLRQKESYKRYQQMQLLK